MTLSPSELERLADECEKYAVIIQGIEVAPDDWQPGDDTKREPKTTLLAAASALHSLAAAQSGEPFGWLISWLDGEEFTKDRMRLYQALDAMAPNYTPLYTHPPVSGAEQMRNDALETAARIVIAWKADPAIAFEIRELKAGPIAPERTFKRGDRVEKISGAKWRGTIVGEYSTDLTPEGYAVESDTETGSVQIYPAKALRLVTKSDGRMEGSLPSGESDPVVTQDCRPSDTAPALERIKNKIDSHLNSHLCDMKDGYDDSICGFNEAWDIVRAVFKKEIDAIAPATSTIITNGENIMNHLEEQKHLRLLREQEAAENNAAIAKAKMSGANIIFVGGDGCEVTVTPSGHVFHNASDWY